MRTLLAVTCTTALASLAAMPTRAQAAPGVTFTATTAVVMPPTFVQMRGGTPALRGTGIAADGRVRVELDRAESTIDKLAAGDVLTSSNGGSVQMTRSGAAATALTADLQDQLTSLTGQFGIDQISAPRVQLIGPGEKIEGRATQHHRITGGYTLKGQGMVASLVIDLWTVDLPVKFSNPLLNFGTAAAGSASAVFEKPLGEAFRKIEGTCVKAVVTTSLTAHGTQFELVQTTTLTDLKEGTIDLKKLAPPGK